MYDIQEEIVNGKRCQALKWTAQGAGGITWWRCSRNPHYFSCHCKTFLQLKPSPASRLVFLSLETCLDLMLQVLSTALQFSRRLIFFPALHTACCSLGRDPQPCLAWKVLHAPVTPLTWEVGRKQKVSGMYTIPAGWSPRIVTLLNTVYSEYFKPGILSVTEGWCLCSMFHTQWFLLEHHCLSLVPQQWHLT